MYTHSNCLYSFRKINIMTNLLIMLSVLAAKCTITRFQKHSHTNTTKHLGTRNRIYWMLILLKLLQVSDEKFNRIYQSRQNSRFHIDNIAFSLTIRRIEIGRAHHLLCERKNQGKKTTTTKHWCNIFHMNLINLW